jgi:predicted metal-dependent hydrolase
MPSTPEPERVKAILNRWYLDHARQVFMDVVNEWLPRFKGYQCPRLIVRAMQSRWGSLSQAGSMTLNVSLVRAPKACVEYVVVHELCHLKHRDHDVNFFRLLGQVMPDWEKRKQRLETALL